MLPKSLTKVLRKRADMGISPVTVPIWSVFFPSQFNICPYLPYMHYSPGFQVALHLAYVGHTGILVIQLLDYHTFPAVVVVESGTVGRNIHTIAIAGVVHFVEIFNSQYHFG